MFDSWVSTPAFVFDRWSGLLRRFVVQHICPAVEALLCIDVFRHKKYVPRSVSRVAENFNIFRIVVIAAKCALLTFISENDVRY